MSLMKRFRDVTVATLNDRLENAQDPVRVIDQFLRELSGAIKETEELYRQCSAHTANLRTQYLQSDTMARKREDQAMLAVKADEEQIARAALAEKMAEEEKRDAYRTLYEQSRCSLDELELQLAELKRAYQEGYHKRQYYVDRMETLRLQQRLHERTRVHDWSGGQWFNRLEERISDLELEARSLMEVRAGKAVAFIDDKIDRALEQLKRKIEGGKEGI